MFDVVERDIQGVLLDGVVMEEEKGLLLNDDGIDGDGGVRINEDVIAGLCIFCIFGKLDIRIPENHVVGVILMCTRM